MRYPIVIILLILLSSCGRISSTDGVVSIHGYQGSREVVRGMGVCIDSERVLTSAHVVRDDRVSYQLSIISYRGAHTEAIGIERDTQADIAYMKMNHEPGTMKNVCNSYKEYVGKTGAFRIGDLVSIPVIRSGSIVTLSGSITSLTGMRLAYDTVGRTQTLSGLILTDILLSPGDSGAPILDDEGRVIDVVHVAE